MNNTVKPRIKEVIKNNFPDVANKFEDDNAFFSTELKQVGITSLDFIKMVVILEQEFDIDLSTVDLSMNNQIFFSFQTLSDYIASLS